MITIKQLRENDRFWTTLKSQVTGLFTSSFTANTEFITDVWVLFDNCLNDLAAMGYNTWLLGDKIELTDDDADMCAMYIGRCMQKKYKYFEFYLNRWRIDTGTQFGDREITDREYKKDRNITSTSNAKNDRKHNSTTNMTYTTDMTDTNSTTSTTYSVDENAPLGSAIDTINTPNGKAKNQGSVTDTTTRDRNDTNNTTVNITDNVISDLTAKDEENQADTEKLTKTFENGIEILKAIKYNNLSIVNVVSDIVDRIVYEYNVVI